MKKCSGCGREADEKEFGWLSRELCSNSCKRQAIRRKFVSKKREKRDEKYSSVL